MSLKESVMVVNLSISQWTARKFDAKASHEVEESHQAKDAGRFNKILIQSAALKELAKVATKARSYHYEHTLPWGDNGDRILPAEKYFDYITNIGTYKLEYNDLVEQFIQDYESERENSKLRLNTLYKESDYPSIESLQKKFDIQVGFMPIADGGDLRVSISDEAVGAIKTQINNELKKRVESATNDIIDRLKTNVEHMYESLLDVNKVFRDSLINNIKELLITLPSLNFNDDPRVTNALNLCETLVVDTAMLRRNKRYRREIAIKAKQILENI